MDEVDAAGVVSKLLRDVVHLEGDVGRGVAGRNGHWKANGLSDSAG